MISCLLSCYLTETTIGIIIGSCFTLAGVIVNGVITYFLNRNTHSLEVEERKRCEQKHRFFPQRKNWMKSGQSGSEYTGNLLAFIVL